jgi:hypothetical protein
MASACQLMLLGISDLEKLDGWNVKETGNTYIISVGNHILWRLVILSCMVHVIFSLLDERMYF